MTTMREKNPQMITHQVRLLTNAALVGIITAFLFVILSTINMFIYPGSYHLARVPVPYPHYSFIYNNLSDMGMLHTFTGEPNYLSAILFALTLTITGSGFLIYVRYFPRIFNQTSQAYKLARIGSILGIITSAAFIAIGWTPWDILIVPHMLFVFIGFVLSLLFNIYFGIAIIKDKLYPNWFAYSLFFYAVLIVGYLLAMIIGPPYGTLEARVIESLGQKIVIYAQMFLQILNAGGLLLVIRKKQTKSFFDE